MTDVAGDANFVNGQGVVPDVGDVSTEPASDASADLLAVWFETAYDQKQILDAATGRVMRVQHVPTGLLVHLKTSAPVQPLPNRPVVEYAVPVSLPNCTAKLYFHLSGANPNPIPQLRVETDGCGVAANTTTGGDRTNFNGTVTTLSFPFDGFNGQTAGRIAAPGTQIDSRGASVTQLVPFVPGSVIDQAAPGRSFTVGSDVPSDIDCATASGEPACGG